MWAASQEDTDTVHTSIVGGWGAGGRGAGEQLGRSEMEISV